MAKISTESIDIGVLEADESLRRFVILAALIQIQSWIDYDFLFALDRVIE